MKKKIQNNQPTNQPILEIRNLTSKKATFGWKNLKTNIWFVYTFPWKKIGKFSWSKKWSLFLDFHCCWSMLWGPCLFFFHSDNSIEKKILTKPRLKYYPVFDIHIQWEWDFIPSFRCQFGWIFKRTKTK